LNIFIYRPTDEDRDSAAVAYAEDGEDLCFHVSSSMSFFRSDMGLSISSDGKPSGIAQSKIRAYEEKYPNGYNLIEVIGKNALQEYINNGMLKGLSF
jgi:hypothetical protein